MSVYSLKKIRSETGASLSFALLLVLVCATAGGVILAAGTVASGRLSRRTEMDQRYYNVVSALDFLREEITDKAVTIVRTKTLKKTEVRTVNYETGNDTTKCTWEVKYSTNINDGELLPLDTEGESDSGEPDVSGVSIGLESTSFLTKQAIDLMFGSVNPICNSKAAMEYSFSSGFEKKKDTDVITLASNNTNASGGVADVLDGVTAEDLTVSGFVNLNKNGNMELKLRSGLNPDADAYRLGLSMIAETSETDDENITTEITTNEPLSGKELTTTTITTTVRTKNSTIKWTPGGIIKWTDSVTPTITP